MSRPKPFFPLSHGVPPVDDGRGLSGIIFINRNGLRWRVAPFDYGPHNTLYNRWFRWRQVGVFAQMLQELVKQDVETEMTMIDVNFSLPAEKVIRSLDRIIEWRGKPSTIRVDNGPEYISGKLMDWAEKQGVAMLHIQPGQPQQDA